MASRAVQSQLYTELGVYRSKVEGSRAIARKANMLALDMAEKWTPEYLEERMASIDGAKSSNGSSWTSTLALIPGTVGALGSVLGKSATLYENMETMVGGKLATSSGADYSWENQLRSDLELLQKKAQDDPEVAKLVDKYLGEKLGPINASADETLSMYPPFKDSKALEALIGLVRQDQASYESIGQGIKKLQDEIEEARLKTEAEQKKKMTYDERMQEIAEQRIYCRLAVRVLQELNPEAAKVASGILQGVMDAQEVSAKLNARQLTASAATGSYILIAISVIDAFQGGGQDQAIQERLDQIVKLIVSLSENLTARLENLQATADLILKVSTLNLQQAIENKELMVELHTKANEIHEQVFQQGVALYEMIQAGFERSFVDAYELAFSHKETHKLGTFKMARDKFDECLSQFLTAAQEHSADKLALPSDNESIEDVDLQEGLFKRPLAANLPYFARALAKHGAAPLAAPQRNFDLWQRATIAMVDLIGDWPDYQVNLKPQFLDQFVDQTGEFERFFQSMLCGPDSPIIQKIATKQVISANNVLTAVTGQLLKIFSDAVAKSTLFEYAAYTFEDFSSATEPQLTSLFDRLKPVLKMHINIDTVNRANIGDGGPLYRGGQLEVPEDVKKLIPSLVKAAWCFGVLELYCQFYMDFSVESDNSLTRRMEISLIAQTKSGLVAPVVRRSSRLSNYPRFPLIKEAVPMFVEWPIDQGVIYAEIKRLLVANPADPRTGVVSAESQLQQKMFADMTSYCAPLVSQAFSDLIADARREVIQVNTAGRDAMRSLIGLYELLNQYVTFGSWETVKSSEKIEGLLFGGDNLVFVVSGTPLFEHVSVDEVRKVLESYPGRLVSALNEAIALQAPRVNSLRVAQQLRDLRAALIAGHRWSSDFAKRFMLQLNGDQSYSNDARSLSGSAQSTDF